MCTCNVEPGVATNLAAMLTLCARALAVQYGVDPDTITIGPVDFGGGSGRDHHQVDSPASRHAPTGGKPPHP